MLPPALQRILLATVLGFLLITLVFPIWSTIQNAFPTDTDDPLILIRLLFSSPRFFDALFNSINLATLSAALSLAIALPLAFITSRYDFRLNSALHLALLLPIVAPPFVSAIGLRKLLSRFGPINLFLMDMGLIDTPVDFLGAGGLGGVAFVQALHLYPILYLSIYSALKRMDYSLEEAAATQGASPWKIFRRITLPLLSPAVGGGGILVFTWSLTDLGTPLVFDYRSVLAVRIFEQADEISSNPMGYALVVTMTALCCGLFLGSRLLFGGTEVAGGSKGARVMLPRKLSGAARILIPLCLIAALTVILLPHIGVVLLSVSSRWFMSILPQEVSLSAYSSLLSHPLTVRSIKNSLILSLGATAINISLGLSVAWLISRGSIRGIRGLDLLVMVPLAVPGVVIAFGYLGTFSGTILDPRVNPIPLLMIGYAVRRLPFMVRSLDAGFAQGEKSLEEAGAVFGASPITVLRRITVPLLAPQLLAGGILCFCLSMLEVSESLILAADEQHYPISKAMYTLISRPDGPMIASALGVVMMIVLCIGFGFASRIVRRPIGEFLRI